MCLLLGNARYAFLVLIERLNDDSRLSYTKQLLRAGENDVEGLTTPPNCEKGRCQRPSRGSGRGRCQAPAGPESPSERNHGIKMASCGQRNSNPASSAGFLSRSSLSPIW